MSSRRWAGQRPMAASTSCSHRQGSRVVVQCKRWKSAQVGVTLIREFFGVTVAEKAERGIFVTTGTFTPDAVEFARGKPIELSRERDLQKGRNRGAKRSRGRPPGEHLQR